MGVYYIDGWADVGVYYIDGWADIGGCCIDSTYCSNISPYNTSERTCIISRMIRASGPWAEGKNIPDYDRWAGRDIIPDGGGWAHVGNMYSR
jgi:hypothetical protein